jgi:hypothetical protein
VTFRGNFHFSAKLPYGCSRVVLPPSFSYPTHRVADADSDEEDTFDYSRELSGISPRDQTHEPEEEEDDSFTYPAESAHQTPSQAPVLQPAQPDTKQPQLMNAEFEKLYGAASSGDLDLLMRLFRSSPVDAFTVSNEASSRTGHTLLHCAASRGHLDVVSWRMCA